MDRLAPNPHSPYATADPGVRHLFAVPAYFPEPLPTKLALTACDELAVVPEDLAPTRPGDALPDGLCDRCVAAMRAGRPIEPDNHKQTARTKCRECGSSTRRLDLCALCRQTAHDAWWPTRQEATT